MPKTKKETFHGNVVFSSLNQLKFHATSRRDDLISLFYLLIYLLKQGNMPGVPIEEGFDVRKIFK